MDEEQEGKYDWIPLFKELGRRLLDYESNQPFLVQLLRDCGVEIGLNDRSHGQMQPLQEIDPFTFAALILKYGSDERRTTILQCVKAKLSLHAPVPSGYAGIPNPNARAAWLFAYKDTRKESDVPLLWRFARAAFGQSIDQELWASTIAIYRNGLAKLTQAMFRFAPDEYLPVDAQTRPYLASHGIDPEVANWNQYTKLLQTIRNRFDEPFHVISHNAWASNQPNPDGLYSVCLTGGAIRNGNISISRGCRLFDQKHYGGKNPSEVGRKFDLHLPDGQIASTDIRRISAAGGGRIRSRFKPLFRSLDLREGAIAQIAKTGPEEFELKIENSRIDEEALPINIQLLALAVNKTIRPLLVDRGWLQEGKEEGYHHHKVIPKAKPLLTKESLQRDAVSAVTEAIKAAANLLSQYEYTRPLSFLKQCDGEAAKSKFLDLIHGADPLATRAERFLAWADWKHHKEDGKPIGFNSTIVSYLLCMSDPGKYAFCKPENYTKAAQALLGPYQLETDPVKRLEHATRFYRQVLEILRKDHGLPFTDLMHVHIAFWILKDAYGGCPDWDELMSGDEQPRPINMTNQNIILYGPPGTGKTYQTANLAVEIIDGDCPDDREAVMQRYRELVDSGRVFFVTFHQSFSYEEFVEGIRPVLTSADEGPGTVSYELRDGVFKQACQVALGLVNEQVENYEFGPEIKTWKISLGNTQNSEDAPIYDDCIEAGRIAIGYGSELDFGQCADRPSIVHQLEEAGVQITPRDPTVSAIQVFKNEIGNGDIVVVSDGNLKFRAIGRVTGDYAYDLGFPYPHVRAVQWLRVFKESLPYNQLLRNQFSQKTLYQLHAATVKRDALKQLLAPDASDGTNVVLIIDEINRGNISKILGELITLLEPDKRLEAPNEVQVRLPYSGQQFGVPQNLYVIGTMNTADRSLAHIDTALRRRFIFEELMPVPSLLKTKELNGVSIDLQRLLTVLNERIEALFDREHMLGHAYFMTGDSLPQVFSNRVVPLLTEYFFEDWSKVRAVLADDQTEQEELQFVRAVKVDGNFISKNHRNRFIYSINSQAFSNPKAYLKIYESGQGGLPD